MNSKLLLVILTCDKRSTAETVQSIKNSDWPYDIQIKHDSNYTSSEHSIQRFQDSVRGVLNEFLDTDYDYLLFLEDDITVNKFIYHNITTIPIENIDYINLCNVWNIDVANYIPDKNQTITGSQGILMSKKTARLAVGSEWFARFDQFLPTLLAENKITAYLHTPSLVQHGTSPSVINKKNYHAQATDYNENFKRDVV